MVGRSAGTRVTVAIDWDDTLVGYKKYEPVGDWLPGAVDALRELRRRRLTIVIHSCRANYDEGRAEILAKLAEIGMHESSRLRIAEGKPLAVLYIDDRGHQFDGDWSKALIHAAAASFDWTPGPQAKRSKGIEAYVRHKEALRAK